MTRTVADVMSKPVIAVRESTPFKELVRMMTTHGVSALPVVDDDGRPVGIVSEADLLLKEEFAAGEREPPLLETRRHRLDRAKASGVTATRVMTSPVVTTRPDAVLGEAARRMHERRVKHLPVVDGGGRMVGIVSRSDLLKVFLRPDEAIRRDVVQEVIVRTLWIDPASIRVVVEEGVVTLEGRLERRSLVPVLIGLTEGVDGVVSVDSRLDYEIDDLAFRPEELAPWAVLPPGLRV